ncbi:hypothetical protein HDU88_008868 [Geranomyces variabilis]|nr:hypothetical protein HDU88_008868 [Geranomyces variabilis]
MASLPPSPSPSPLPPLAAGKPSTTSIHALPAELLKEIICQIDGQAGVSRASQTCKLWHAIAAPVLYLSPDFTSKTAFEHFVATLESGSSVGRWVRELNLLSTPGHWDFLTDAVLKKLLKGCPELSYLDLEGCYSIHDKGLKAIAKHAPQLHSLSLSYCDRITNSGVSAIAARCGSLRHLEMACCPMICDTSILKIAAGCPLLESMNLAGTHITEQSVFDLATKCKGLTYLDISACYNIVYLQQITEHKPEQLEIVTDSLPDGVPGDSDEDIHSDDEYFSDEDMHGHDHDHDHGGYSVIDYAGGWHDIDEYLFGQIEDHHNADMS